MGLIRRVAITAVSFALVAFFVPAQANEVNRAISWQDTDQLGYNTNLILRQDGRSLRPCNTKELTDVCAAKSNLLTIFNIAGPCETSSEVPCIDRVWIKTKPGDWIQGEYQGERSAAWSVNSWPDGFLPGLDRPRANNLYTFKGVTHGRGHLYEINPIIETESNRGDSLRYKNLRIVAYPVFADAPAPGRGAFECLQPLEDDRTAPCWKESTVLEEFSLRVSLLIPSPPSGWATGRILEANIVIEENQNSPLATRLIVEGSSSIVPVLSRSFLKSNQKDFDEWNQLAKVFNIPWSDISAGPLLGPNSIAQFTSLIQVLPSLDKATGERNKWVVNFSWDETSRSQSTLTQCQRETFVGYAGSNSLTFENSIPRFNAITNSLLYVVASPHYRPDGSEATGKYQLVLDSDVARCLWKYSGNPVKAEISVVSDDGNAKVATVSMVERDGFLKFSALGYTYSKSQISVRIPPSSAVEEKVSVSDSNPTNAAEDRKPVKKKVSAKKTNKKSKKKSSPR